MSNVIHSDVDFKSIFGRPIRTKHHTWCKVYHYNEITWLDTWQNILSSYSLT